MNNVMTQISITMTGVQTLELLSQAGTAPGFQLFELLIDQMASQKDQRDVMTEILMMEMDEALAVLSKLTILDCSQLHRNVHLIEEMG